MRKNPKNITLYVTPSANLTLWKKSNFRNIFFEKVIEETVFKFFDHFSGIYAKNHPKNGKSPKLHPAHIFSKMSFELENSNSRQNCQRDRIIFSFAFCPLSGRISHHSKNQPDRRWSGNPVTFGAHFARLRKKCFLKGFCQDP